MRLPRTLTLLVLAVGALALPAAAHAASPSCTSKLIKSHAGPQVQTIALDCTDANGGLLRTSVGNLLTGSLKVLSDDGAGHVVAQWTSPPGLSPAGTPKLPLYKTVTLFTFQASDGRTSSNEGRVLLYLDDHAPTCSELTTSTRHSTPVTLSARCTDPDGDPLRYSIMIPPNPSRGTVGAPDSSGRMTFTPAKGFVGQAKLRVKAFDGRGADGATITVNVTDRAPTCVDPGELELARDVPATLTFTCTDPDGEPLTIVPVGPAYGTLGAFTQNGSAFSATYTPGPGYVGADAVAFVASDGDETSPQITVPLLIDGFGHAAADPRATAAAVLDALKLRKIGYARKTGRLRFARVHKGQLPVGTVLRVKLMHRRQTIGVKTVKIGAGATPVGAALNKAGRRYVFPRRKAQIRIEFRITVPGGHVVRDWRKLTLAGKAKPKPKHHRRHHRHR